MTVQSTNLRSKSPESLVEFLKLLLLGMLKRLPLKLLLAGGIALLAWIIHTYLLVVSNEGFNAGQNFWLDRILALSGRSITGSLVWTLGAGIVTSTIARILAYGFGNTMRSVTETPRHIWNWAAELGVTAIPLLVAGYFFTIIFGFFVNNVLLIAQIFLIVLGIIIARQTSVVLTMMRLGWSDAQKMAKRKNVVPFKLAWPGTFLVGELVGLLAIVPSGENLPFLPFVCGCLGFLLIIGLSVGLFLRSQGGTEKLIGKKILLWIIVPGLFTLFFMMVRTAFADDGGWQESGGTLSGWLRSPGAARAVLMGILPAAGSGVGVLLGTALGSMVSILGSTGLTADPFSIKPTDQPTSAGSSPPDASRTGQPQVESYQYETGQSQPAAKTAEPPLESRTADPQTPTLQQQTKTDPNAMPARSQSEGAPPEGGDALRSERANQDVPLEEGRTGQEATQSGLGQRDTRGVDPQPQTGSDVESTTAAGSADQARNLDPKEPADHQLASRHQPDSPTTSDGPTADRNRPGGLTEQQTDDGQLASQRHSDSGDAAAGPMADRNRPGGLSEQSDTPEQLTDQQPSTVDGPLSGPSADRNQPGGLTEASDPSPADLTQGKMDASRHSPANADEGALASRHEPTASAGDMQANRFTESEEVPPMTEPFTANDSQDSPDLIHERHQPETAEPEIPLPPVPIPPVTLRWELVVIRTPAGSGLEPQQRLPLKNKTRIGRHGTIDIKILDPKVSRQHADIKLEGDQLTLVDLNSSNGTYINGKRMSGMPQTLQPGDAIKIGDTYFVLEQRPA